VKINRPSKAIFWISVILVVLGLLGEYGGLELTSRYDRLLYLIGYVLLFLGVVVKGM